jgi:hypothetical protein
MAAVNPAAPLPMIRMSVLIINLNKYSYEQCSQKDHGN